MKRATVSLSIFACLLATAACADSTAPQSRKSAAPNAASNTRYILASGDSPGPGCRDLGNGLWLCDDTGEAGQTTQAAPIIPDTSGDPEDDSQN